MNKKTRKNSISFSKPLSDNIRLLGDLLGEVIKEQAGNKVFNQVEILRNIARKIRHGSSSNSISQMMRVVKKFDSKTTINVIKAFTIYFHLVNKAEKFEIIRVNKERTLHANKNNQRKESIFDAICNLKKNGNSTKTVQKLINNLSIEPIFTAHPTEAKRLEILRKLQRISKLLIERECFSPLTQLEDEVNKKEIKNQITLLWRAPDIRDRQPTVKEEAENTLFFLTETVFDLIPDLYTDLDYALKLYYPKHDFHLPTFIKFGSWVGGDRDGNPNVTPGTTKKIVTMNSIEVLKKYIFAIKALKNELAFETDLSTIENKLGGTLEFLLKRGKKKNKHRYHAPIFFIRDLETIKKNLIRNNVKDIAVFGSINKLVLQVKTFGFHFVELDIRQHSDKHEKAVTEILNIKQYKNLSNDDKVKILISALEKKHGLIKNKNLSKETKEILNTLYTIKEVHENIGKSAIRCYIISFTKDLSDVLEVLLLSKIAGLSEIDIVPLFETIDDLKNSEVILESILKNKAYRNHLKKRGDFQEIMLGYSDSGKDGGYLSANIELFKTQEKLSKLCKKHKINWRFFHGRGGSLGRGGAQAGKAIQAAPQGSVNHKIRFTEQGEVFSFRYSIPKLAHRHLEAIIHSTILSSESGKVNYNKFKKDLFEKLSVFGEKKYRSLVFEDKDFWEFFTNLTPYKFMSLLNIASRPVTRHGLNRIDDLRAITWGFSLTQTRMMLNSWFGFGTALRKVIKSGIEVSQLQKLYMTDNLFKVIIDNSKLAMYKADMNTAYEYSKINPSKSTKRIFKTILDEFKLTKEMILTVTCESDLLDNKPVLRESIRLRNPYTDPLNCIQIEMLKRNTKEVLPAVLLSIKGIAAAMQETG